MPTHPIAPGGPPPGIWPSPGYPSHPIAPGGPPPGIWGGAPSLPTHPIIIAPPPDAGPEHPIVIIPPPNVWPGLPSHPIVIQPPDTEGGTPSHPIVIVPPNVIWPSPGVPTHPIAPGGPPPGLWPPGSGIDLPSTQPIPIVVVMVPGQGMMMWTAGGGWQPISPGDGDGGTPEAPTVTPH